MVMPACLPAHGTQLTHSRQRIQQYSPQATAALQQPQPNSLVLAHGPCTTARGMTCALRPASKTSWLSPNARRQSGPADLHRLRCHSTAEGARAGEGSKAPSAGNGTFLLMMLCVLVFISDNLLHLPGMQMLHLYHAQPQWWQFVSHQFCHASWSHLSSNLFQLCVFGRFVEDTEGFWGVVAVFLLTGIGAALASIALMPANSVGVGASGAIFGLFAASVLLRVAVGFSFKSLLEAAILGNFVVRQLVRASGSLPLMDEMKNQVSGGISQQGIQVAHVAHLGGAMAGILLVLCISRLPRE